MLEILQRVEALVIDIDERLYRERKADELKKLIDKFSRLNKEMERTTWAYRFVRELTSSPELDTIFENTKSKYQDFAAKLVKLWGDNPEKIDIMEPSELFEPINDLFKVFSDLQTAILRKRSEVEGIANKKLTIAKNFSIIPDIDVDLEYFKKATYFLDNAGETAWNISAFVKKSEEELNRRINTWNLISKKIADEEKKFDFTNIKGKQLSKETKDVLNKFIENDGEIEFHSVSGIVVEEINSNFPELAKKLRIGIF